MLTNLIASGPARSVDERGTAASLLLHVGVIASMIIATQVADPLVEEPRASRIVPLIAPARPTPPTAAPARPRPTPTTPTPAPDVPTIPTEVPSVPVEVPTGIPTAVPTTPLSGEGNVDPNALPSTDVGNAIGSPIGSGVLDADGVDVPVRLRANSPLPRYPDILRQSGVRGHVRVRFVVGTDGRAELGSVEILEHSHPAFAEAVRNVLPRLRFTPARVGTRTVRQMVEIPFGFELR